MWEMRTTHIQGSSEGIQVDSGSEVLVSVAIAHIWREGLSSGVESLHGSFYIG